ncbi:MAG: hypothetical protein IPH12_13770 [Saprospirales bacterium]|nr:hypothetical protein [Saprospirales bacterium]MBK8922803.1 hypothetical protein [Saprospirales bacterium]
MPSNEQVDVFIYRVRETGLEVFLVNPNEQKHPEHAHWKAITAADDTPERLGNSNCIELEPVTDANGASRKAIAVEADWHELPSLRALIYEDYRVAKEKAKQRIKSLIPEMEQGAFFAVREAFKRVLPEQYAFLKELKEVLVEKNSTKYL